MPLAQDEDEDEDEDEEEEEEAPKPAPKRKADKDAKKASHTTMLRHSSLPLAVRPYVTCQQACCAGPTARPTAAKYCTPCQPHRL